MTLDQTGVKARAGREDPWFCECCTPIDSPPPTLEDISRIVLLDRQRVFDQLIREERRPGSLTEWLREAVLVLLQDRRDDLRSQIEAP